MWVEGFIPTEGSSPCAQCRRCHGVPRRTGRSVETLNVLRQEGVDLLSASASTAHLKQSELHSRPVRAAGKACTAIPFLISLLRLCLEQAL